MLRRLHWIFIKTKSIVLIRDRCQTELTTIDGIQTELMMREFFEIELRTRDSIESALIMSDHTQTELMTRDCSVTVLITRDCMEGCYRDRVLMESSIERYCCVVILFFDCILVV